MLDSEEPRQPDGENSPDAADGRLPEQEGSEAGVSRLAMLSGRFWQRRYQMAGVAGVVAALGTAALVAGQVNSGGVTTTVARDRTVHEGAVIVAPSGTPSGSASPTPQASGLPAFTASASPSPHRVPPAVAAPRRAAPAPSIPVTIATYGSLATDRSTMRVVSAHGNLAGQRELAWVADGGHTVGDARCSQDFRFTPGAPGVVRPTMLMCWRTSATKSVYTIAIDLHEPPSEQASVAVLDKTWSAMH